MTPDHPPPSATAARDTLEATPVFALNTVLYPEGPLPLRIFEPRYVDMVSDRLRRDAPFIVALIRSGREVGGGATTHSIGTLARIVDWNRQDDGLLGIVALGGRRVEELEARYRFVTPRFDDASFVGYRLSELLPMPLARKQQFLEIEDPLWRLRELAEVVAALSERGAQ